MTDGERYQSGQANPHGGSGSDGHQSEHTRRKFPPISGDGALESDTHVESSESGYPALDGYEIIDRLGAGGMGEVWRARQLSTNREVAVKLMQARPFCHTHRKQRFEREVELAAKLEHSNIARIYDSGINRGYFYYAMYLIDGRRLDEYVKTQRPSRAGLLDLFKKICMAVAYAHQHGVLHRDLKPSNILVDERGEPHLLDFGLAASLNDNDHLHTMTTGMIGTIPYMSPEQATGDGGGITTRSDVYSLGVMLYELLSGKLPHDPEGSPYTLLRRVAEQPVRPLRRYVNDIPSDLEAIVDKAINHDAGRRYATPDELAADLGRFLAGETVTARRLTMTYFMAKWLGRHRLRVAVISSIFTAFLVLGVYSYVKINLEKRRAVYHADRARQQLYQNRIEWADQEIKRGNVADAGRILSQCPQELRGWEWRYLKYTSDSSLRSFESFQSQVHALAWDATGERLFAFYSNDRISSWHYASGSLLQTVELAGSMSNDGVFIKGAEVIVVNEKSMGLSAWDTETGLMIACLPVHAGENIKCLAGSEDGRLLAGISSGGLLHIWETASFNLLQTIDVGKDLYDLSVSCDGRWIAATGGRTCVWHLPSGYMTAETESGGGDVSISRDHQWLAVGHANGSIEIRKLPDLEQVSILQGHTGRVAAAHFLEGDAILVSASTDKTIRIWDIVEKYSIVVRRGHLDDINAMAYQPRCRQVVTGAIDGSVRAWDISDISGSFLFPKGNMLGAFNGSRGSLYACLNGDASVVIMDLDHLTTVKSFPSHEHFICHDVDAASGLIAVGDPQGVIKLFDPEAGQVSELSCDGPVIDLRISPDNHLIAIAKKSGRVELWDINERKLLMERTGHLPMAWLGGGRYLAYAVVDVNDPHDMRVSVIDVERKVSVSYTAGGHSGSILHIGSGPEDNIIATGGDDGMLKLWNLYTGKLLRYYQVFSNGGVGGFVFTDDGKRFAAFGNSSKWVNAHDGSDVLILDDIPPVMVDKAFMSDDGSCITVISPVACYQWHY